MFEGIKGVFIIIILCILLTIVSKLIYLLNYIINNKAISVIDEIDGLDYESFYYLALESLSRKNYENFLIINDNILKCTKNNEEYIVVLNNGESNFLYSDSEIFYGYMITYGIKKILFFITNDLSKEVKEFFYNTNVEVIIYEETDMINDYNAIIKNV